jgi:hypothetical protein
MDADLKQYLDDNFARIDERFGEMEKHLEERIEQTETKLLKAFHGWARPMEVRVHGVATMVLGFEERLALAEQRISELERKGGN